MARAPDKIPKSGKAPGTGKDQVPNIGCSGGGVGLPANTGHEAEAGRLRAGSGATAASTWGASSVAICKGGVQGRKAAAQRKSARHGSTPSSGANCGQETQAIGSSGGLTDGDRER